MATMSPGTEDKLLIKGLGGKKTLSGEIRVNSAKNAVLKAMAASVLFKDPMIIKAVPVTEDTKKMSSLLSLLGAEIVSGKGGDMLIDTRGITSTHLDHKIGESMRASVVLTGPMLARYGAVSFPAPGGCVIGPRPIDIFLDGYQKMGAEVVRDNGRYVIKAKGGKLRGAEIFFNIQTVGGTETLMMAAVLAKGKTVLRNCAMEPEIVSLAEYLISCGAKISGHGTPTMTIVGGSLLSAKRKPCKVIPDRIEAGCFVILGALCADDLTVSGIVPEHIQSVTNLLRDSGVPLEIGKNYVRISKNGKVENQSFKGFNVRTHEYPGLPTDLQAPVVAYLTQVSGESKVFETIYESRFKYVQNLLSMGADITVMNPREILIRGPKALKASTEELDAYDIRAGFATIIAALTAKGNSMIHNAYYIDRGHEAVDSRLRAIGADVTRVHGSDSVMV
jgi:UDP-N-acetylglucosamine 1-carboxyvinyltransferase